MVGKFVPTDIICPPLGREQYSHAARQPSTFRFYCNAPAWEVLINCKRQSKELP